MSEILYEVFDNMPRLAPGSDEATRRCLSLINMPKKALDILDIGCGTGAQSVVLASELRGRILAVDNHQPFLDQVDEQAKKTRFPARISTRCMDMNQVHLLEDEYDLIWSEGAAYIMGFGLALEKARKLLKGKGYVVFSELNWLKANPPKQVADFFRSEHPAMMSVEQNISLIESKDFRLVSNFMLGYDDHWFPYYAPLSRRLDAFRKHYADKEDAMQLVDRLQQEIDLFKQYSDYYGYVYYVMQVK